MTREEQITQKASAFAEKEYESDGYEREWLSKGYYHGYNDGYKQAKDGEIYEKKCAIAIWLRDNLDRYDNSIGLTKDEFIGEFTNFINKLL